MFIYLHNLVTVQPPRSSRSSSLVTLTRPPTSSSLRLTESSFRYASPCVGNQLPIFLQQHHTPCWFRCLWLPFSCTCHLFPCWFSTLLIHNSPTLSLPGYNLPVSQILPTPDSFPPSDLTPVHRYTTESFIPSISLFFSFSSLSFIFCSLFSISCSSLNEAGFSFQAHVKRIVSCRTVVYRETVRIQ